MYSMLLMFSLFNYDVISITHYYDVSVTSMAGVSILIYEFGIFTNESGLLLLSWKSD